MSEHSFSFAKSDDLTGDSAVREQSLKQGRDGNRGGAGRLIMESAQMPADGRSCYAFILVQHP